jgi:hypothetical protein
MRVQQMQANLSALWIRVVLRQVMATSDIMGYHSRPSSCHASYITPGWVLPFRVQPRIARAHHTQGKFLAKS